MFVLLLMVGALSLVSGHQQNALCSNEKTVFDRSCSSQILDGSFDTCTIKYFPSNSSECRKMEFGPFINNNKLGEVILEPYIFTYRAGKYDTNYTVLNITFTNIKWNTMKFRFERKGSILKNHCRNIEIAHNVTVLEQSVLYYDCWWSDQDSIYVGENYILDFRAEGDAGVKRGQYYFTVPSVNQLSSSANLKDWKPFVYIEIGGHDSMILHIKPAPPTLGIEKYQIEVVKECQHCPEGRDIVHQKTVIKTTGEVTYSHSLLNKVGSYYFVVTPIHKDSKWDPTKVCHSVKSPAIVISSEGPHTVICIASITSVVVAVLFVCYLLLWVARRKSCRRFYKLTQDDESSRFLVIYSPTNKIHEDCVNSFVSYLRYECGLYIMYDADIAFTSHRDPFVWFKQAFDSANTIINIVGPLEESNHNALTTNHNFEQLQMTLLKECRVNKNVINVLFEHSKGQIPTETLNDRTFHLLRDWNKLMSFLTKNQLPRVQLQRTEKGRRLYENLKDAKKYFGQKSTVEVVVKDVDAGKIDKKALL